MIFSPFLLSLKSKSRAQLQLSCVLAPSLNCHLPHWASVLGVTGSQWVPVVGKIDGNSGVMPINSHACFHFLISLQSTKPNRFKGSKFILAVFLWSHLMLMECKYCCYCGPRLHQIQVQRMKNILRHIKVRKNDRCVRLILFCLNKIHDFNVQNTVATSYQKLS